MRFLCISYGADVGHLFRRSAHYVDKILKGTKPSDLPVQQVITVELLFWIDQIVVLSWLVPAGLALVYSAPSPPGPYRIHRTRLAVPVWSLAQGSIFAAPLAPIVRAAARLGGRRPHHHLLRLASRRRLVCRRDASRHREYFAHRAEMVGVSYYKAQFVNACRHASQSGRRRIDPGRHFKIPPFGRDNRRDFSCCLSGSMLRPRIGSSSRKEEDPLQQQ